LQSHSQLSLKSTVIPSFKKGKKEDPGNYRLVSLTLFPWKVMERFQTYEGQEDGWE